MIAHDLTAMGWTPDFAAQIAEDEAELRPARLASVHRRTVEAITPKAVSYTHLDVYKRQLQSMVFAVGKDHGFDPLRDWFKALYEVLLGASDGPRFGGFVALYGIKESLDLIDRGLAGELVA